MLSLASVRDVFRTSGIRNFLRRVTPIIATFATGQGLAQLLNLASGFFLLRWLHADDYGRYGLFYSFDATANVLTNLGLSGTIIALVGTRTGVKSVVGSYIRAVRGLRATVSCFVLPAFAIYFFYLTSSLHWPVLTQLCFAFCILVSGYSSGVASYYGSALLINRDLKTFYALQVASGFLRLSLAFLLYKFGVLTGLSAVVVNTFSSSLLALSTRVLTRTLIEEPEKPERNIKKQIIDYIMPNLPSIVFFALQGQAVVFLIAAFGNERGIAQVSALSRIGQIFVFLGALNPVLLEPWFAKTNRAHLPRRFALVTGACGAVAATIFLTSTLVPGLFLALLGSKYSNLRAEVVWLVASCCVTYVANVVWTIAAASRFIYWNITWVNIFVLSFVQIIFVALFGVATPLLAVQFGLCTACASLAVELYRFSYGLSKGPRIAIETHAQAMEYDAVQGAA